MSVWSETSGALIGDAVGLARGSWERARGLLGRRQLRQGQGLWLTPCSGVHTVGMAFAIDVVGLDKHRRVVRLWQDLKPLRVTALSWSMRSALELPSGTIARTGIRSGDVLRIQESVSADHA